MSEESNVAILKEAYQYWNDNREQAFGKWMDLMSDDIKLESIADGAKGMEFTRCCNGKDDVLRYFQELTAEWEMIHYTVKEYIAQRDRVVAIGSCGWRNRKTGKEVDTPKADIIRMKDSKIVDFYEFYDTAKAISASTSVHS